MCDAKRAKLYVAKNHQKRLAYEQLRATYKNRATKLCATCLQPGNLEKHTIDNKTAYYHANHVPNLSLQRKRELQELSLELS